MIKMLFFGHMGKQTVECQQWNFFTIDIHNLSVSQRHYDEWLKQIIICCTLYDFVHITFYKLQSYSDEEQISDCWGVISDCYKQVAQMRFWGWWDYIVLTKVVIGLPRWRSGKESTCQCRRHGFSPWVGKIPWRRNWQPVQNSCLGNLMEHGGLQSMGLQKSWTWLSN